VSQLVDQAARVVEIARRGGAQHARATAFRSTDSGVEWRDGKTDRMQESVSMGIGLTLFVDGRYSSNSTSDLRPDALEDFVSENIAATRLLAEDPHRRLPDPTRYENRFTADLEIFDEAGARDFDAIRRRDTAARLEQAVRSAPGAEKLVSVTTACSSSVSHSAKVSSNGMRGSRQSTVFFQSAVASVRDAEGRKPRGFWADACRHVKGLLPEEQIGRRASGRALVKLGAAPVESGNYPCIIENVVADRLLGWLIAPLYGSALQQNCSFFEDLLGKKFASGALTVVDKPHLTGGLASRTYDGEGMSTAERTIFDRGVVGCFLLNTYYASKLGMQPTSGSTTNVIFPGRGRSFDELLSEMGKGILITDFSGGNSNPATGDFSVGIGGQWIEKGKTQRALSEMNLSGNHLDFWNKLLETGDDPHPFSAMRTPSLRFDKVQFSGI